MDVLIAMLLIACLAFSTVSKYERAARETVLMLAPCHIVTAIYVYVLLTTDAHCGAWWFNIVTYLSFFTALALAVPDLAGLTPLGHTVFWVHHWALVAAPLYLFWTDRYPLWSRHTVAFYWQASGFIGALCCFVVHQVTSLTFSLNVNYMLYPPPGQPIQGRFCKCQEIAIPPIRFFSRLPFRFVWSCICNHDYWLCQWSMVVAIFARECDRHQSETVWQSETQLN